MVLVTLRGNTGYRHQQRLQLQQDHGHRQSPWQQFGSEVTEIPGSAQAIQISIAPMTALLSDTNKATGLEPDPGHSCGLW